MNKLLVLKNEYSLVAPFTRLRMICEHERKNRIAHYILFVVFVSLALISLAFFCISGFGKDMPPSTVTFSSITTLNNLSKNNKYFTIDDVVRVDGLYYRFFIKSPHGNYDVLSIRELLKVCHEIRVIEEYRATKEGNEAWNAAGESLKNIGRGAKRIVKEPKESAKAFAQAGGKIVRSIGRFLKKQVDGKGEEKAGDGTDRDKGGEGLFVGKHARQFAAEVGLDVYTDNPYAQALIKEVAKARAKGSIGTSVGLFFLSPVQGLGLLSNSLTPNGFDAETEKLICDESPAELRYVLTEKYKKELGIECAEGSPVDTLLNNSNYSPREQAYLYFYLKYLAKPETGNGVEELLSAIEYLGKAKSPDAATFATNQMELLSAYQKYEKNLTKLVVVSRKLGAVTGKNELILIIPYDIVGNTLEMKEFPNEVVKFSQSQNIKRTHLWCTGDVMSGFTSESKSKRITVKENVLQLPHFAPKNASTQSK